jgi:flagellar motor switch protein FliN
MSVLDKVSIELTVVLGATRMPIHQLLRMGRGAVIELDASEDDDITIYANDVAVARGQVALRGDRMSVSVTAVLPRPVGSR